MPQIPLTSPHRYLATPHKNSDSILAYGFLTVVNPFSKYVAGGVCISSDPPLTHGSDKSNGLLPAVSPELHDPIFPPACPTIDSTDVPPAFGMCTKTGNSSPSVFDCRFASYLDVSLAYVSGGYAPNKTCVFCERLPPPIVFKVGVETPAIPSVVNNTVTTAATATILPFAGVVVFEDAAGKRRRVSSSSTTNKGARSCSPVIASFLFKGKRTTTVVSCGYNLA